MAKAQRKYKDTVFRMLFGNNRRELLELYNAVNDSHYDDPGALSDYNLGESSFSRDEK